MLASKLRSRSRATTSDTTRTVKERIQGLTEIASLCLKVALAIGVVVLFNYCAFQANFFPTGVGLGDSLLFVFAFLGFGIGYVIWVGLGYSAAWGLFSPFFPEQRAQVPLYLLILLFFAGGVFTAVLIFLGYRVGGRDGFVATVMPIVGGFLIWLGTELWKPASPGASTAHRQSRSRSRLVIIFVGVTLPGLFVMPVVSALAKSSLRNLGVHVERASLVLSEDNYKVVAAVARQANAVVLSCKTTDGKAYLVHGFRVWWHGIGDRSLVELLPPSTGKVDSASPAARIELQRDGLNVIRWTSDTTGLFETCLTIPTDALFDTGKRTPNSQGEVHLGKVKDQLLHLQQSGLVLKTIHITGHSDRIPVRGPEGSNFELSKHRAESVQKFLSGVSEEIEVIGMGPLEPKVHCKEVTDTRALNECLAPNRRVELVVGTEPGNGN